MQFQAQRGRDGNSQRQTQDSNPDQVVPHLTKQACCTFTKSHMSLVGPTQKAGVNEVCINVLPSWGHDK